MFKRVVLSGVAALAGLAVSASPASAEESFASAPPVLSAPLPPLRVCHEGAGLVRVFDSLVFVMDWCDRFDARPGDTVSVFMNGQLGASNPSDCTSMGGRFERVGDPDGFNLQVCWGVDF